MAGHSKFKNIQHRKGAQDQKRAKQFTKLVREIVSAAKIGGPDVDVNPALRSAIISARSYNLPKDRIDKALSQASDTSAINNYDHIRYEGFLSKGVAIIVETLTNNKNRTVADVRSSFSKYGGELGASGSVVFMFDQLGVIEYSASIASLDEVIESGIQAGAQDVISENDAYYIHADIENFSECLEYFNNKYGAPIVANIEWKAHNNIIINDYDVAEKILKFTDILEENDDVQKVFGNYQFSEEVMEKLYLKA